MDRFLALCVCLSLALADKDASSLSTRQSDGAVSDTYFLRRGYHACKSWPEPPLGKKEEKKKTQTAADYTSQPRFWAPRFT